MEQHSHSNDPQAKMELELWDFIDGTIPEARCNEIAELISSNIAWRNKYHELLEAHELLLNTIDLEEPSMRFTMNVMEEIGKSKITPATQSYFNKRIIWGVAWFFILMIAGFLVYGFSQVEFTLGSGQSDIFTNVVDSKKVGNFFNNYTTAFLGITMVSGLMLLDMVLQKKRKTMAQ